MKRFSAHIVFGLVLVLFGCNDDTDLPSVEERKDAREQELISLLTRPQNGWKLTYRPTPNAGSFLMLMQFDEDGLVNIQSDVTADDGAYLDHQISYRIDHDLATELILETYGVFHYLFELNQNSFGAEYEFIYQGESGENLVFVSKSDDPQRRTVLTFEPASPSDRQLISTEIVAALNQGSYRDNLIGISPLLNYRLYMPDDNLSVFVSLDLETRRILFQGAGLGNSFEELRNSPTTNINRLTDLALINDEIIFNPLNVTVGDVDVTLSKIAIGGQASSDSTYCPGGTSVQQVSFEGAFGEGISGSLESTLYTNSSTFFDEETEFYNIGLGGLFDQDNQSMAERIDEQIPGAEAFFLIYQGRPRSYTADTVFTGVGFLGVSEEGDLEWYLREMDITTQEGNLLEINLTDEIFINVPDSASQREALISLTDEIFEGGSVFGNELFEIQDLFEIYNPCNGYKVLLFE